MRCSPWRRTSEKRHPRVILLRQPERISRRDYSEEEGSPAKTQRRKGRTQRRRRRDQRRQKSIEWEDSWNSSPLLFFALFLCALASLREILLSRRLARPKSVTSGIKAESGISSSWSKILAGLRSPVEFAALVRVMHRPRHCRHQFTLRDNYLTKSDRGPP